MHKGKAEPSQNIGKSDSKASAAGKDHADINSFDVISLFCEVFLIMLIRRHVNAEFTVWVNCEMTDSAEFVLSKEIRIVLLCVCHDRCGIQADERAVNNPKRIELSDQTGHNFFRSPFFTRFRNRA